MEIEKYTKLIGRELLPHIQLSTQNPFDPIVVENHSHSWKTIGSGNYAGVFSHDANPKWVVKVYGRSPEALKKEIEVYEKLGNHPTFSTLIAHGENYLILKRIRGMTLFEAVVNGVPIPESVIHDVDKGLDYAKGVGLNPFDVHGKNIVMYKERGYIVDVSDFYKSGTCHKWNDLKKAYYKIYQPLLYKYHPSIPYFLLDLIRKGYRLYRKINKN
jgi:predicted Ser/Thr protein kinase